MHDNRMCHLTVTMKSGESYQQRNLMLSDININNSGISVTTQLSITNYHIPNIEVSSIRFIDEEKDES